MPLDHYLPSIVMNHKASVVASSTTYIAGSAAVAAGLTASEWAAITGAACAVVTLFVNWVFKIKVYRLMVTRQRKLELDDE